MKIIDSQPPKWLLKRIKEAGMTPTATTVFAYGRKIYNPSGSHLPEDLLIHEAEHGKQQGLFPYMWWRKYLKNPVFRIEQEIEAYGAQYHFICGTTKNNILRNQYLTRFAQILSGPLYGIATSYQDARRLIVEDCEKRLEKERNNYYHCFIM